MSLIDGLVGYWPMDEADGTKIKNVVNGVWSADFAGSVSVDHGGKIGRGKKLNGGYYPLNLASFYNSGPRTYSFWIQCLSAESDGNIYVLGSSNDFYILMGYGGANRLTWWGQGLYGSNDGARGLTIPRDNVYHHVVFGFDGTNLAGFFNGQKLFDLPTANAPGPNSLALGGIQGGADELGVWNRRLSDEEVAELYNDGAGIAYPFYFHEVAGNVVDNDNLPVQRTIRAYRRSDGKFMGETQSSPTSGDYSLSFPTADEVNIIMLDDAAGVLENDRILRTIPA